MVRWEIGSYSVSTAQVSGPREQENWRFVRLYSAPTGYHSADLLFLPLRLTHSEWSRKIVLQTLDRGPRPRLVSSLAAGRTPEIVMAESASFQWRSGRLVVP